MMLSRMFVMHRNQVGIFSKLLSTKNMPAMNFANRTMTNKQHVRTEMAFPTTVTGTVVRISKSNWSVALDTGGVALLPEKNWVEQPSEGSRRTFYVEGRDNNGVCVVGLRQNCKKSISDCVSQLKMMLQRHGNFLHYSDRTDPLVLQKELGMSKRQFKQALGKLLKARIITMLPTGISLIPKALRKPEDSKSSNKPSKSEIRLAAAHRRVRQERNENLQVVSESVYGLRDTTAGHRRVAPPAPRFVLPSPLDTSSESRATRSNKSNSSTQQALQIGRGSTKFAGAATQRANASRDRISVYEDAEYYLHSLDAVPITNDFGEKKDHAVSSHALAPLSEAERYHDTTALVVAKDGWYSSDDEPGKVLTGTAWRRIENRKAMKYGYEILDYDDPIDPEQADKEHKELQKRVFANKLRRRSSVQRTQDVPTGEYDANTSSSTEFHEFESQTQSNYEGYEQQKEGHSTETQSSTDVLLNATDSLYDRPLPPSTRGARTKNLSQAVRALNMDPAIRKGYVVPEFDSDESDLEFFQKELGQEFGAYLDVLSDSEQSSANEQLFLDSKLGPGDRNFAERRKGFGGDLAGDISRRRRAEKRFLRRDRNKFLARHRAAGGRLLTENMDRFSGR